MEGIEMGGWIALAVAFVKTFEVLISKWIASRKKDKNNCPVFTAEDREKLEELADRNEFTGEDHERILDLHKVHCADSAKDANGVLKWWVPRAWGDKLDQLIQITKDSNRDNMEIQRQQMKILDKMNERMERVEARLSGR